MKVTDEMVQAAIDAFNETERAIGHALYMRRAMRAAIIAALSKIEGRDKTSVRATGAE